MSLCPFWAWPDFCGYYNTGISPCKYTCSINTGLLQDCNLIPTSSAFVPSGTLDITPAVRDNKEAMLVVRLLMHQNASVCFSCTTALLIGFQILALDQHIHFEILIVY